MKLRFTAAVLTAVCLLITGCAKEKRSLLWYQDRLSAVTLSDGVREWEIVPGPEEYTLTLTAPAVRGIVWHVADASASVSAGDTVLPAGEAMATLPRQLTALLRLTEEQLTAVEPEKDGSSVTARYRTDAGEITVRIGEAGLPLSFRTETGEWTVTDCRLAEDGGNESTRPEGLEE